MPASMAAAPTRAVAARNHQPSRVGGWFLRRLRAAVGVLGVLGVFGVLILARGAGR